MRVDRSRAICPSSRQIIWLVTITLLLTYSPIGSASSMVFLYSSISFFNASGEVVVKHNTPIPILAGFSNVLGLSAATHIGGCGSVYGFGSTLRGGIEKNLPSYE